MKLPRNVSNAASVASTSGVRHRATARLPRADHDGNGEHHEVIPLLTVSSILKSVARHHEMTVEELLRELNL